MFKALESEDNSDPHRFHELKCFWITAFNYLATTPFIIFRSCYLKIKHSSQIF
jgi:hypothetical protein